jgi:hypothetical protein
VGQGGKRARTRVLAEDGGAEEVDGDDEEEEEDGDDAADDERTPDKTALSRRQAAGKAVKDSMVKKGKRGGTEDKLDKFMISFSTGRDRVALQKEETELFELLKDPDACRPDRSPLELTFMRIGEGVISPKCLRDLDGAAIERIGTWLRGTLPRTFTNGVNQIKMMAQELQMT